MSLKDRRPRQGSLMENSIMAILVDMPLQARKISHGPTPGGRTIGDQCLMRE